MINRLVNYILFSAFHEKLQFDVHQNELVGQLSMIAQQAGINGVCRSSYGDKNQY